jgi:UDP-N-acetylglucosamine:LPS N-acetylglucosamine transferase
MSQAKRILIITDKMPWGHRSIAKAIFNYLKTREKANNWQVTYAEVDSKLDMLNDIYTFVYRLFPATNRLSSKLMEYRTFRDLMKENSSRNMNDLKKVVSRYKPDLVISAYFFLSISLAKWREESEENFKIWTVVADPWSINPVSMIPETDLHLVYDDLGVKFAKSYDIDENKVLATGWWTRAEMYCKYDKKAARKKLGFDDDRPVIFVGGGSLGTSALPKLLPMLMFVKTKIGIIFNSGTDKLAYNMVEEYARIFKRLKKDDQVIIKNLGWIENMAEVLAACDIVFGKAGPNFLFDTVASGKPFVAITHIGGQEDGNIEIIKKKKLGWVKEKNGEAGNFFLKYLENPKDYNHKLDKYIKAEAENNKKSFGVIEERLKKDL